MGTPTDGALHEVCHGGLRTTPNRFYGPLYIIKFQIIQIQRLLKTILGTTIKSESKVFDRIVSVYKPGDTI
nr:BPK_HP1_G0042840.mRNA.1.CDS.1 [Saccharomyces cerevisiae]